MINPFIEVINQVLPEPQAGLLNGILFGIKASLPKDFYQALITTGTVHMIALSGQNISILTAILSQLTLNFGRRISSLLTIVVIIGFVMFVGLEPSIIRAAIMGSLSLLSVYFGRQNWSLLGLFLAGGVMLLINPYWIGEVSFQLSFLATLGIILFGTSRQVETKHWMDEFKREIRVSLRTTLAAQIFTLPIIFFRFHQISLIAPITNVLVGWTVAPIMLLGFIVSLAGWIFLPLGQLVGFIVWVPLTYMITVVHWMSKLPFAVISF